MNKTKIQISTFENDSLDLFVSDTFIEMMFGKEKKNVQININEKENLFNLSQFCSNLFLNYKLIKFTNWYISHPKFMHKLK